MKTTTNLTELQAIQIAKSSLKEGFTFSIMNKEEVEDFIWGYLYDYGLQYELPIDYIDEFGNKSSVIIYQNNQ